jgi:hypothetical protein
VRNFDHFLRVVVGCFCCLALSLFLLFGLVRMNSIILFLFFISSCLSIRRRPCADNNFRGKNFFVSFALVDDSVRFHMEANSTGWIGIGFSKRDAMDEADFLVISRENDEDEEWFISDLHATGKKEMPVMDEKQDGIILSAHQFENTQHVIFERKVVTNDKDDLILAFVRFVLFAIGSDGNYVSLSDYSFEKHQSKDICFVKSMVH